MINLLLLRVNNLFAILFLAVGLGFFLSCQSNEGEHFKRYVLNDLGETLHQEDDFYVVWDIKSCGSCLNKTKEILSKVVAVGKQNIHVIVASPSRKDVNLLLGEELLKNLNVIYDVENHLTGTKFFTQNNFYVFEFRNGILVDNYYYNYSEHLDKFEKSIKRFKNVD